MQIQNPKTAIVVGATGLVGKHLTEKLLNDSRYERVKIFVRRSVSINHPKLEENIVDFRLIEKWENKICGNDLFSALGTTIKKAGSKENQYLVDYTFQYEIARAAAINNVENYFLVSSIGANRFSINFYLRIKGALEHSVSQMPFNKIVIFQPSFLVGEREKTRFGERIGSYLANIFTQIIPGINKYRPINAGLVADAMINAANDSIHERIVIYKPEMISIIAQ